MMKSLIAALLLIPSTGFASDKGAVDVAFRDVTRTYAVMRIVSDNCSLPAGEWVSAKARALDVLSRYPGIDIIKVDRTMDRYYEQEKDRMGKTCSDDQRAMFERSVKYIDSDIDYLRELVTN